MKTELTVAKSTRSLNGWQLKCAAMLFMTIDHIGAYGVADCLPHSSVIYPVCRVLGRIAAPVFLYLCIEGIRYTRSRWFYLKKLYLMGVLSSLLGFVLTTLFPQFYHDFSGLTVRQGNANLESLMSSNMFFTFFVIVLMITSAEELRKALKNRERKKASENLLLLLLPVLLIPVSAAVCDATDDIAAGIIGNYYCTWYSEFARSFFPTVTASGYTCVFLPLGYYWYLVKDRKRQMAALLALGAAGVVIQVLEQWTPLYIGYGMFEYPQFFMVLAVPFLACYNGERGRKNQWFSYAYYPVHIVVLDTIGVLASRLAGL